MNTKCTILRQKKYISGEGTAPSTGPSPILEGNSPPNRIPNLKDAPPPVLSGGV